MKRRRILLLIPAAALLAACSHAPVPSPAGVEMSNDSSAVSVSHHVAPVAPGPLVANPFPRIFLNEKDIPADRVALAVDGLAISDYEYEVLAGEISHGDGEAVAGHDDALREELLLLGWLQEQPLLLDPEFEAKARRLLRSQLAALVLEEAILSNVHITDDEIVLCYNDNISLYRQPHRVGVRLILVATSLEADEVMQRIHNGEDFGEVARQVSLHSSRAQGGKIDPFSRGTLTPQIEDLAFGLETGETGMVSSGRGVFIIEKIADNPESITPIEQVRDQIHAHLYEEKRERARQEFLRELERSTYAEIERSRSKTAQ